MLCEKGRALATPSSCQDPASSTKLVLEYPECPEGPFARPAQIEHLCKLWQTALCHMLLLPRGLTVTSRFFHPQSGWVLWDRDKPHTSCSEALEQKKTVLGCNLPSLFWAWRT